MSARAVKFIRDQAHRAGAESQKPDPEKQRARAGSAQAAAHAVRRMLTGDERQKHEIQRNYERTSKLTNADPLYGWDRGVSERKAHLCLLLKPQIVLCSKRSTRSVLVLAADHVILRNYGILDTFNAEDPVSGYVMQRYAHIPHNVEV
jgi:Fmp27, WPPW motif-containing RBG unit